MVLRGEELLDGALQLAAEVRAAIEKVPGLHVLGHDDLVGPGLAVDFDPLPTVIDATGLGTGYRAADWLRHERHVDMHLADHRRISAQLTHADSTATAGRLLDALRELAQQADELADGVPDIVVPTGPEMRLEQAVRPRDAYRPRGTRTDRATVDRVAAEMITPYPPGIPAFLPGERLTQPVLDYLRTGLEAGMNLPDVDDPGLQTVRVRR
jgi:lysine decarboxylase